HPLQLMCCSLPPPLKSPLFPYTTLFRSVTTDGGTKWTNVTPPQIKPWTRIFNIEAGHFDNGTAYAAANTLRIDDVNPHFWRTHEDRKSTRLNSSHQIISYAVFCLKKKKQ